MELSEHVPSIYKAQVSLSNKSEVKISGASKLVQQVKAPDAKPNELSLIPGTDPVKEENWLLWTVLWPSQACRVTWLPMNIHITHLHIQTWKIRCNKSKPLPSILWKSYFMCITVLPAYRSKYQLYVWYLRRLVGDIWSPGTLVTYGYALPNGCWESNPSSPKEQGVLLTSEFSFQPLWKHFPYLYIVNINEKDEGKKIYLD